ncbi:MAG: response regulator [Rhodospirillaceae bacterium]
MPTVLVADDDPLLVEVISHKLRRKGLEVLVARDGVEALRRTREDRPDLVVLDAMMPGLDGFAVLRELKKGPDTAAIPVLMLTARKTERDVVSGLSQGAADYVTKPFQPAELVTRISRLLAAAGKG